MLWAELALGVTLLLVFAGFFWELHRTHRATKSDKPELTL